MLSALSGEHMLAVTESVISSHVPSILLTRSLHGHAHIDTKANVERQAPLPRLPALATGVDCPPPEPPPQDSVANDGCFNINEMMECIPHVDQAVFA